MEVSINNKNSVPNRYILENLQEKNKTENVVIQKRFQHRCFPVNIAKFLRTPILKNICEWLLLVILESLDQQEKHSVAQE